MRQGGFRALTVALILLIIVCMKGTVMSRENGGRVRRNQRYAALERAYLDRAERLLEEEGFPDCGVNMTWVAYEDGRREYTVLLYHRRFGRMSGEDKSALADRLSTMEFEDGACSFAYEL